MSSAQIGEVTIIHPFGFSEQHCPNCGCVHSDLHEQQGHLCASNHAAYPKPKPNWNSLWHWCAGVEHHPKWGTGHQVWAKLPLEAQVMEGWKGSKVPEPHEVYPQGTDYILHLFSQAPNLGGFSYCCSQKLGKDEDSGLFHLWTSNPDAVATQNKVKCSHWMEGVASLMGESLKDGETLDPIGNDKANCLICGWPRSVKGLYKQDGTLLKDGEYCQGMILHDEQGHLAKVVCHNHCSQCHQPKCQCCSDCHHYPCACDEQAKEKYEAQAKKSFAAQVAKEKKLSDLLGSTQGPIFEDPPPPKHKKGWIVNHQWQCQNCKEHIKFCTCKHGPSNAYFSGDAANTPTQCMPAPWIHRGQIPKLNHYDYTVAWPNIKNLEVDPVEWAADFYLYQAICSGGLNTEHECDQDRCTHRIRGFFELNDPPVLREARHALTELIDTADRTFCEYIDMACGGEVRHHPSLPQTGALDGNRPTAWAQWRDIRDLVGLQALLDMAQLFLDYQTGTGGIAGERWANAALLLHRRLTGGISKETFVDQTFSLVHNGGVFLNKLEWKNSRLYALQGIVLPAQARDDFDTLLDYASRPAVEMFAEAWRETNRARIMAGVRPARFLRERGILVCETCSCPSTAGHRAWECRKGATTTRIKDRGTVEAYRRQKYLPNWSWDMKTLYLYRGQDYRCGLLPYAWSSAKDLLNATVTVPDNKRTLVISDGNYNFVKFPISKFKGQEWNMRDLLEIHGIKVQLTDPKTMQPIEEEVMV